MDSVVGQESLASGGVSADEIAAVLADSIPRLPIPGAPVVVPTGRPPAITTPNPQNVTINQTVINNISDSVVQGDVPKVPTPPQVPAGPPLPPSGLPPGWSMEQWQHYGHQWLAQQGQQ